MKEFEREREREIRVLGEREENYAEGLLEESRLSSSASSKKGRLRLGRDELPSIVESGA